MSGATIGGVIGGVVGFFIPGVGPQLGWMIGSAIGGYVDPEQISQFGPRLTDASQQTARDGVPIPYGYGTFPCHGNLIWCSDITEHVNESTDDGKGSGQEVTTTTYTYTRSYAIGICQGEIAGLLQIKRNGKVVWDTRTDEEFEFIFNPDGVSSLWDVVRQYIAQARAFTSRFSTKLAIYTGSNTQTADPTMEAHKGVGNVTGYRGLAYIVVTDDDVTELRGAVPQYEFVVSVDGTASQNCTSEEDLVAHWPLDDAAPSGSADEVISGKDATYYGDVSGGGALSLPSDGSALFDVSGEGANRNGSEGELNVPRPLSFSCWCRPDAEMLGSNRVIAASFTDDFSGRVAWGFTLQEMQLLAGQGGGGFDWTGVDGPTLIVGQVYFLVVTLDETGVWRLYVNGDMYGINDVDLGLSANVATYTQFGGNPAGSGFFNGAVADVKLYNVALTAQEVSDRYLVSGHAWAIPGAPGWYVTRTGNIVQTSGCVDTVSGDNPLLSEIVATEFQRVGLTSDDYDVSDLEGIEVLGYRVLPNGSGVDAALGPLMQAYFFDIAEWDGKLRCIKRGGASSLALTMDDLAERDGEAIEWTRVQEAELLRSVTVGYIDPAAGYAATTQKWERRAGTVQAKGESAVEIAITATADTAATIAKKRGLVAWAETEKAKISLPYRRAAITPTDVNTLTDASGEAHRLRVGQIEDDSGVRLMEVIKERGNVYDATADGVSPGTPTPGAGTLFGPTALHAMNLPRLSSGDNQPGIYVAVTGLLPGWQGADLHISADGGVSEQFAKRIMSRATMGLLADECTDSSEPITVSLYDNRTLSSVTVEQLSARQNAFSITSAGTSEVGQFLTATENVDEDWELTGTSRGALGTTAASHSVGDAFVLLDQAVHFVPLDISLAGKPLILRAVSIGTAIDDNQTIPFTFLPQFIGPEETNYLLDESRAQLLDEDGGYLLEE